LNAVSSIGIITILLGASSALARRGALNLGYMFGQKKKGCMMLTLDMGSYQVTWKHFETC